MSWEGVAGASEHRTTGDRAWCFDDGTWCYDGILCRCCMEASSEYIQCPTCIGEGFIPLSASKPESGVQ